MQGASGTYAFNNTDFLLPPTSGKWNQRDSLGIDGLGHSIYPAVRTFELTWALISTIDLKQIIDVYNTVSNTGTVVACLPKYGDTDYIFFNYSGVTMQEVSVEEYFQGYVQGVRLLLMNIRT